MNVILEYGLGSGLVYSYGKEFRFYLKVMEIYFIGF